MEDLIVLSCEKGFMLTESGKARWWNHLQTQSSTLSKLAYEEPGKVLLIASYWTNKAFLRITNGTECLCLQIFYGADWHFTPHKKSVA